VNVDGPAEACAAERAVATSAMLIAIANSAVRVILGRDLDISVLLDDEVRFSQET
jgi:hypothetical protein